MKKIIHGGCLILALVFFGPATAMADLIEGRVAFVREDELGITVYDAQGRPYPNTLNVQVDRGTRLSGINSLSELSLTDPIGAEVYQIESGQWRAESVSLFEQIDVQPATKKPSPSLSGALGNPMVKGALLGAATGAIASKSSGGKAGKGALIGAGVGALLGGMFNQSSDDSSR